uniref:Uncharacterized protein n=1 Tax=Physcomitrium patens TaxID=3218 RepID=A0A2K1IA40_PHYPA|nr:hypothetical protein PHYPA_030717 [Physcomitrium patens]
MEGRARKCSPVLQNSVHDPLQLFESRAPMLYGVSTCNCVLEPTPLCLNLKHSFILKRKSTKIQDLLSLIVNIHCNCCNHQRCVATYSLCLPH